jgi:two-component system, NarL family, sensor histidine kinase DegS
VEQTVPNQLPDRLPTILANVERAIASAESDVALNARELGTLVESIEQERARVQAEIEQLTLDRLVQETSAQYSDQSSGVQENDLRAAQTELTNALGRITSLQQRVVDFEHLLTAAKRQFSATEELPGVEDAQALNQRQAMIRAKEEERRRLSREIHDGPAQVLANAIIGLEFIERSMRQSEATANEPAVEEVERIKASMRDGLSEIRRFIFDLRPTMLAQRGLLGTVQHYLTTYKIFLPDDTNLKLPEVTPILTPEQELTAFRVIQESLQNVHRHSDATRVWITIELADGDLKVEVRDNGRGFDPSAVRVRARGGAGISGMRERAEVIGARLDVDSSAGQGCAVRLLIPITARMSEDQATRIADQRRTT